MKGFIGWVSTGWSWQQVPRKKPLDQNSSKFLQGVVTAKDGLAFHEIRRAVVDSSLEPADFVKKHVVTDDKTKKTHERTALELLADAAAKGNGKFFSLDWKTFSSDFNLSDITPQVLDSLFTAAQNGQPEYLRDVIIHFQDKITIADRHFVNAIMQLLSIASVVDRLPLWEAFQHILGNEASIKSFLEQEEKNLFPKSIINKIMINFVRNSDSKRWESGLFLEAVNFFGLGRFDRAAPLAQVIDEYKPEPSQTLQKPVTLPDFYAPESRDDKQALIYELLVHCLKGFPNNLNHVLKETEGKWMPTVIEVIPKKFKIEDIYNSIRNRPDRQFKLPERERKIWWMRMIVLLVPAEHLLTVVPKTIMKKQLHHAFCIDESMLLEVLNDLFLQGLRQPFTDYWKVYREFLTVRDTTPDLVLLHLLNSAFQKEEDDSRDELVFKIPDENSRKNIIKILAYFYIFDTYPDQPNERIEELLPQLTHLYKANDLLKDLKKQMMKEQKAKEQQEKEQKAKEMKDKVKEKEKEKEKEMKSEVEEDESSLSREAPTLLIMAPRATLGISSSLGKEDLKEKRKERTERKERRRERRMSLKAR